MRNDQDHASKVRRPRVPVWKRERETARRGKGERRQIEGAFI
jgi:hypothetical protein